MSALYPTTLQRCGRFALHDRVVTDSGEHGTVEICTYRFIFVRLDMGYQFQCDPHDLRHEAAEEWRDAAE